MIDRQKVTGWILVVVSGAFIAYFLKVRLLTVGPMIERREWLQFIGLIACLMIGFMNIRLAARRAQSRADRESQRTVE